MDIKEKIKLEGCIEFDDISSLKLRTNFKRVYEINIFLEKISIVLGISLNNLTELLNLKPKEVVDEKLEIAVNEYEKSDDKEKLQLEFTLETIKDYIEKKKLESSLMGELPGKLYNLFVKNAYVDGKVNPYLDEAITILSKITKIDYEILLESHYEVLFEIFLRSVFGYRDEVNSSFFTSKLTSLVSKALAEFFPSLIFSFKEKLNKLTREKTNLLS